MDTIRLPDQAKERLIALLSDPVAHNQGKVENNVEKECFTNKRSCKRAALLVLAAVMLMSALSVGAACWVSRFRSLEAELHMTEEQRRLAEESGLSASPDNSRTAGEITSAKACGITVTVEQTITDRYFALFYECYTGFLRE